ncbi:MAG: hypothetical protein JXA04_01235 [Gammaproteobacteria bacterium]|nr:hypothetical protein [Gammaproteobacteria bacterium]
MAKNTETKKTPDVFKTRREAAAYLGVSERTISNYLKNDTEGVLKNAKGYYIRNSLDRFKENNGAAGGPKTRVISAEADIKEFKYKLMQRELEIEEGRLVSREDVEKESIKKILMVKRVLLGLPRKLPPLLKNKPTRKMQDIIRAEIIHCINIFAKGEAATDGSSNKKK